MKRLMIFLSAVLMLSCTIAGAQRIASSSFTTLAYIRDDGTVQDSSFRTIGYAKGIPRQRAAFYFFFME